MIHVTDITGLAGNALGLVAACLLLPGVASLRGTRLALLLGAVAAMVLIPFGELPLAGYLRGGIGDLSITSCLLLALAIAHRLRGQPPFRPQALHLGVLAAAALALYPMALGAGPSDPYRLGYGDPLFLAGLLAVALLAVWQRLPLVALGVALGVAAWSVGWYESSNLWDYLLDPPLAIYAAAALVRRGFQALFGRHRAGA